MRCKFSRGRIKVVSPCRKTKLFYQLDIFYYRTDQYEDSPGNALKVLSDFVEQSAEKGVEGLIKEYRKTESYFDPTGSFEIFKANMTKNRYSDVACLDKTRVRLKLGEKKFGDYIHANYIESPLLANKYICTQGPLKHTVHDFWRMVFQERIGSIIMLCKPAEDGRPKCVVYWPDENNQEEKLPSLIVKNVEESTDEFSTITKFTVSLNPEYDLTGEELTEEQKKPLTVVLHRWTTWPDRGVPDHTSCMHPLQLLERIRSTPCVVHCSAGIGRTGSLMAIELALQRVAVGKKIDFEQIMKELRGSRAQSIQTEVQYLYINRVLVEYALGHVNLPEKVNETAQNFLKEFDQKLSK